MSKERLDLKKLNDGKLHEFTATVSKQSNDSMCNKTYLLLDVKDLEGKYICEHVWVGTRNSKQRKVIADKIKNKERARIVGKVYEYTYSRSGDKNYSFKVEKVF